MLRATLTAICLISGLAYGQTPTFPQEQIVAGARLYADHCAVCHGTKMVDQGGGFFDLRTFPPAQRSRFFNSVSNGKNSMPPWRSLLTQEQIASLFAYVVAGEKN
jgi:mono/diheme cytochrome c family protein